MLYSRYHQLLLVMAAHSYIADIWGYPATSVSPTSARETLSFENFLGPKSMQSDGTDTGRHLISTPKEFHSNFELRTSDRGHKVS